MVVINAKNEYIGETTTMPMLADIIINLPKGSNTTNTRLIDLILKDYGIFTGFFLGFIATYFKNVIDNYYRKRSAYFMLKRMSKRLYKVLNEPFTQPLKITKWDIGDCKAHIKMMEFLEKDVITWKSIRAIEFHQRIVTEFQTILQIISAELPAGEETIHLTSSSQIEQIKNARASIISAFNGIVLIYKKGWFYL